MLYNGYINNFPLSMKKINTFKLEVCLIFRIYICIILSYSNNELFVVCYTVEATLNNSLIPLCDLGIFIVYRNSLVIHIIANFHEGNTKICVRI